ncbi:MAG: T9SS type A sorting domain-containing protein [Bacteroidia bacterium]
MKKISIILTVLVLTLMVGQAQTNVYHPFPDSSAVWIGTSWSGWGTDKLNYDDYNLYISGDTTIGLFSYHKLYRNGVTHCWPCPPLYNYYYKQYAGAFRQDIPNKKVYLYQYGNDTLAYDFNLNVGDTLATTCLTYWQPNHFVQSIDSVLVGGQYRKRFWIDGCTYALTEGVGSMFGAFGYIACPFESGADLWCMRINNQIAWTYSTGSSCTLTSINKNSIVENKISISQNPFSTETSLTTTYNLINSTLSIYNSSGQLVKQIKNIFGQTITLHRDNLVSGIYFLRLTQDNKIFAIEKLVITDY